MHLSVRPGVRTFARVAIWLLAARVFAGILWEYRWYIPPDFDTSAFLSGRRYTFEGLYRIGFYAHILVGPPVLLIGLGLWQTAQQTSLRRLHGVLGRVQFGLIVLILVPSGLVMANQSYGGPIAAMAFQLLAFATGFAVTMAAWMGWRGYSKSHRQWALRCLILLASPLLLRVAAGSLTVLELESEQSYQLIAWASWLLPLMLYEASRWRTSLRVVNSNPIGRLADE